ncbi:hypothetical protein OH76DRAFT_1341246 [Lentinus brumalis]|uniref:Uncharacterized protein n=1 Tax=Lentinus brumalis TaxID=2498619 RepID=A0A371DNM5_9APHY|nr:hypothetical protein OH76DRAFT_1341246 [Polyporus brumalis]
MCFDIVSYIEWACGFRQNTGRQHLDCRHSICRLSDMHNLQEHDCDKTCTGTATSEQHLVTDTYRAVCEQCRPLGRKEHPGMRRGQIDRGAPGGIQFRYLTTNYA